MNVEFTKLLRHLLPEYMYTPGQDGRDRIYIDNPNSNRSIAFCAIIFDNESDKYPTITKYDLILDLSDPELVDDLLCYIISADNYVEDSSFSDWVSIRVK